MNVVGVDGCPGGWVAVRWDSGARTFTPAVHGSFGELLDAYGDAAAIGVDIPIGLSAEGPRRCDVAARRALGFPRSSSVFPAPHPDVLDTATFAEALERSRTLTGKGISRQGFGIYPKVAEVDRAMSPALQGRVVEVHPEVSFWKLAGGRPMAHSKKRLAGFEERRALLIAALGVVIPDRAMARQIAKPAGADDVLDAMVAAWTANRVAAGEAARLPDDPTTDRKSLRMEIVF